MAENTEQRAVEDLFLWSLRAVQLFGGDPEAWMKQEGEAFVGDVMAAMEGRKTPIWDFERRKFFFGEALAGLIKAMNPFVFSLTGKTRLLAAARPLILAAFGQEPTMGSTGGDWDELRPAVEQVRGRLSALEDAAARPLSRIGPLGNLRWCLFTLSGRGTAEVPARTLREIQQLRRDSGAIYAKLQTRDPALRR